MRVCGQFMHLEQQMDAVTSSSASAVPVNFVRDSRLTYNPASGEGNRLLVRVKDSDSCGLDKAEFVEDLQYACTKLRLTL